MTSGKLQRDDTFELSITGLDDNGQGIGSTTRVVNEEERLYRVSVPGAIPGDRVRAQVTKVRKRRASARALQLNEASCDRVDPRCAHAMRIAEAGPFCGGCGLQHMAYEAQLQAKHEQTLMLLATARAEHDALVERLTRAEEQLEAERRAHKEDRLRGEAPCCRQCAHTLHRRLT